MPYRLERQRPPIRFHKRRNTRLSKRGYATSPHEIWGDRDLTLVSVTAGSPGYFTPTGAEPATLTALQAAGALGQTATWTTGQYVLLGNGTEAYWNGTAWTVGRKP